MKYLLLALLLSASVCVAEEPPTLPEELPPNLKAEEGLYRNYTKQMADLSKNDEEKELLNKLAEDDRSLSLVAFLGYFAKVKHTRLGEMRKPDGSSSPLYTDTGFMWAQQGMRLIKRFEATLENRQRYIFVFAQFTGWPGHNNTCVILTDDKHYLIDWCGNEQSEMLKECSFEENVLKLTCDRRQGGQHLFRYDILSGSISKRGNPEFIPRRQE